MEEASGYGRKSLSPIDMAKGGYPAALHRSMMRDLNPQSSVPKNRCVCQLRQSSDDTDLLTRPTFKNALRSKSHCLSARPPGHELEAEARFELASMTVVDAFG